MKLPRKKRRAALVPLTSFGDIAFLLIIFFMVASVFMREGHIDVREAASPDIDKVKASLSVIMDREGELWIDGKKCPKPALESQVSAALMGREKQVVMLKIDKDRRQEDFGDVLRALAETDAEILLVGRKEGK